jgi:AbrB family looped-hinge helix DNA binding protein
MAMTTLSSKNQITLPADVRAYLHAKPGDKIMINMEGMHAVLRAIPMGKPGSSLEATGILKPYLKGKKIDVKAAIIAHVKARDERSKKR